MCIYLTSSLPFSSSSSIESSSSSSSSLPSLRCFDRQSIEKDPLILEAFQYWSDALDEANRLNQWSDDNALIHSNSTAASMCGINHNNNYMDYSNGSKNNNDDNNDKNKKIFNLIGYDNEVINLSNETTDHNDNYIYNYNDNNNKSQLRRVNLLKENIQFMIAYVSLLCNFAEIYEVSGNLMKSEEYISAALKVIQEYSEYHHDQMIDMKKGGKELDNDSISSSSSSKSSYSSDVSDDVDLDTAHYPILGRVLGLAAMRELSIGQIITAEGKSVYILIIHPL